MLRNVRFILIILVAILSACGKNEVKLEFALPADLTANYPLVYYASDKRGGMIVELVASIMNGKGILKSPVVRPTLIYLSAGGKLPLVIYAENHDNIKVTGDNRNSALWNVGGNRINEDLSLWRNAHATTLLSGSQTDINEAVADYVEENPDNPVAAILLLTAYSRYENEGEFRKLWHSLGEEADKMKWLDITGRADMQVEGFRAPGILRSMALRSLANGVDTIRPADHLATILFFWNNGMTGRRDYIDSLKKLAKEYPDSASRMIADISIDVDSTSWRSPLRSDSTKDIARFWVPAGVADLRLLDLQVTRLPFFIVFNPDGSQSYRGEDVTKAMDTFRKVATVSDSLKKVKTDSIKTAKADSIKTAKAKSSDKTAPANK